MRSYEDVVIAASGRKGDRQNAPSPQGQPERLFPPRRKAFRGENKNTVPRYRKQWRARCQRRQARCRRAPPLPRKRSKIETATQETRGKREKLGIHTRTHYARRGRRYTRILCERRCVSERRIALRSGAIHQLRSGGGRVPGTHHNGR